MISPSDDSPHEHGGERDWEESLTFDAHDAAHGYAVHARMTHRPGDRKAEAGLVLSLPGGETAQSLHRAQNAKRAELTVGRLSISITEPLQRFSIACRDVALVFPQGEQRGVAAHIDVALTFEATGAPDGVADRRTEMDAQKFLSVISRGSFTQPVRARGTLKIGTNEIVFEGEGARTRTWGAPGMQHAEGRRA